jgi:hypothetical protein
MPGGKSARPNCRNTGGLLKVCRLQLRHGAHVVAAKSRVVNISIERMDALD